VAGYTLPAVSDWKERFFKRKFSREMIHSETTGKRGRDCPPYQGKDSEKGKVCIDGKRFRMRGRVLGELRLRRDS